MTIIEISALDNGAHRNQTTPSPIPILDGWAVIPDGMETENFPFGEVTAEEINGAMTVTSWTPGIIPETGPVPEPPEPPAPTLDERVTALETEKASQADVDELNEALNMILTGYTGEEGTDEAGTEG